MTWALVTGGSRGLGAATAIALSGAGFDVALTYRTSLGAAERVAETVESSGRKSAVYKLDLGNLDEVSALGAALARRHRLAVLVNNAGEDLHSELAATETKVAERLLAVNTLAPIVLTRELVPELAKHGGRGSVVNVSSIVAVAGALGGAVYAASKSALIGFTRSLAIELAPQVRANVVVPGVFATDMNRGVLAKKERLEATLAAIPLGRLGKPGECAEVIAFLASPSAAYITGSCIEIDGGVLARLALPDRQVAI